jgi:hypothetical protein
MAKWTGAGGRNELHGKVGQIGLKRAVCSVNRVQPSDKAGRRREIELEVSAKSTFPRYPRRPRDARRLQGRATLP